MVDTPKEIAKPADYLERSLAGEARGKSRGDVRKETSELLTVNFQLS